MSIPESLFSSRSAKADGLLIIIWVFDFMGLRAIKAETPLEEVDKKDLDDMA